MAIAGTWRNDYDSEVTLFEETDGFLYGDYRSHTGETGTYLVVGFRGNDRDGDIGIPIALSVAWRPIDHGEANVLSALPGWHSVSGFCGQLLANPDQKMSLIHALIMTVPVAYADPGAYIDKLTFDRIDAGERELSPEASALHRETFRSGTRRRSAVMDPLEGAWCSVRNKDATLEIVVAEHPGGFVWGRLNDQHGTVNLYGFTDRDAISTEIPARSLTLSGRYNDKKVITLAGSLNLECGELALCRLESRGTSLGNRYTQTVVAEIVLERDMR